MQMQPALWFRLHVGVQLLGLCVAIASFIMALTFVPKGSHFTAPHHKLGLGA
jgi:hypothetical protein